MSALTVFLIVVLVVLVVLALFIGLVAFLIHLMGEGV